MVAIRQSMSPRTATLLTTAAAGGMVDQAKEFSIVQTEFAAVETRLARAPGNRSAK
jgi:hypothetical protein